LIFPRNADKWENLKDNKQWKECSKELELLNGFIALQRTYIKVQVLLRKDAEVLSIIENSRFFSSPGVMPLNKKEYLRFSRR
jgi:hypothetical protein